MSQEDIYLVKSQKNNGEGASARTVYDLNLDKFVSSFLGPTNPQDTKGYMIKQLVTPAQGAELEGYCLAVKDILYKEGVRDAVANFVDGSYKLISSIGERQGIPNWLSSKSEIKGVTKANYDVLKDYCALVEQADAIDSIHGPLGEISAFGQEVSKSDCYNTAKGFVEDLDNFGKVNLGIKRDYFGTLGGMHHVKMEETKRWKEALGWYKNYLKVGAETAATAAALLPTMGHAMLFYIMPRGRERLYGKASDFLVGENTEYMNNLLEKRMPADFLLGAARFKDKIDSYGLPLAMPQFDREYGCLIEGVYHPMLLIQKGGAPEKIVPNSIEITPDKNVLLLTGTNSSGKSVFVKELAMAYLLGHRGFPVPAKESHMCPVDRVYTHFTHPEDILLGESAYVDELRRMKELIQNATPKSFLVIDEPIKGSSPEDEDEMFYRFTKGFSMLGAPAIITTHHHKVAERAEEFSNVRNIQTDIRFDGSNIVKSYQIKEGRAGKSYGVEVADACGLSEEDILEAVKLNRERNGF